MNKVFSTAVAFLLLLSLIGSYTINVCAEEFPVLSEMTTATQIEFLEQRGVEVPGGEVNYEYWGPFISDCIALVESDPAYMFRYNWTVSQDFAMAIQATVNDHYGITPDYSARLAARSTLTLVDSEALTSWNSTYLSYNCYAYALEETSASYRPGNFSGNSFTALPSIDTLANYVIADLVSSTFGHTCVALYTTDSSAVIRMNSICMRLSTYDYHFMRKENKWWQHKPGSSAPLRYLRALSSQTPWTDEGLYQEGVSVTPSKEYTGQIYYFTPLTSHFGYSTLYTGNDYHSGSFHFYEVIKTCISCGDQFTTTIKEPCSGSCEVGFNSIKKPPIIDITGG